MYNRILGVLLFLMGIGGMLSLVQTISNAGWTPGKKVFVGLFQLFIVLIPVIFGIKAIKKKLCSEKTAFIWIILLLLLNSLFYISYTKQIVRYFTFHRIFRQPQQFKFPDIIQATTLGDIEKMKKLISDGVDVNETDAAGFPALMYANTFESMKLLVENGANVNFVTDYNVTILNKRPPSTYYSSHKATKFLLENGLDKKIIKIQTPTGSTPLHYGDLCSFCDEDPYLDGIKNMALLIKHGAPLNVKNTDGETPIFTVNDESKKFLMDNGADIFVINNKNENLLFKVKDPVLFMRLVSAGLDKTVINSDGASLIHYASNKEIIGFLVSDVNINHQDNKGKTALFWCFSNPNKLKALLEYNPDVNITDNKGNTALHPYVRECWNAKNTLGEEIVKLLLETNIKINHKNNKGKTALDYARYDEMKKLLIEKGAKPSS